MWGAHEGMGWWMLFSSVFWLVLMGLPVYIVSRASGGGMSTQAGRPDNTPKEPR